MDTVYQRRITRRAGALIAARPSRRSSDASTRPSSRADTAGPLADLAPDAPLTIVTHQRPDLDATTAVVLVERLLAGRVTEGARRLADWVCTIDRGETRLDPVRPVTPYSVFLARQRLAAGGRDTDAASRAALESGADLVRWVLARLDTGLALTALGAELEAAPDFAAEFVQPDAGVDLKGLGDALEDAETARRRALGQERRGTPRPGYASPDPWYDGRSPLHRFTIVDAPHGGTVLTPPAVRAVFEAWLESLPQARPGS